MRVEDFDHTIIHSEEVSIKVASNGPDEFIVAIRRAQEASNKELCRRIPVDFRLRVKEEVRVEGQTVSVRSVFKPLFNGDDRNGTNE